VKTGATAESTAAASASMARRRGLAAALACAFAAALPAPARASETKRQSLTKESKTAEPPPDEEEDEEPEREFQFGLDYASAYVFRGENVFKEHDQSEQKMVAQPRFTWMPPDTHLSMGYAAAYQLNGDNIRTNLDEGVGAEQDLFIDYDFKPVKHWTISTEVAMLAFPAAVSFPLLFEGSAETRWVGPVEVGLYTGYLFAARPGPLSQDHFYLSPHIERSFELHEKVELTTRFSAGWKFFKMKPLPVQTNSFDLLLTETLSYYASDAITIAARVGLAWTNLEPEEDEDGVIEHFTFGDGLVAFVGVSFDLELQRQQGAP
jgi:hypothetical protein